jgi:hypothetical protein
MPARAFVIFKGGREILEDNLGIYWLIPLSKAIGFLL